MTRSRAWSTIDLDRPGKAVGWVHLPWSTHRSAYGNISVPIGVVGGGRGPTVLLMAGSHGDEYEGQIALLNLLRDLQPEDVSGRLVVLPAANMPAAQAGLRTSPIDGGNLNRAFPGDPEGSPTAQIAYYIDQELFSRAALVSDFHSGGSSLEFQPYTSVHILSDVTTPSRQALLDALLSAAPPRAMIFDGGVVDPRIATHSVLRRGAIALSGEYGGCGSVSAEGIKLVDAVSRRLLRHMGLIENAPAPEEPTEFMAVPDRNCFVLSERMGIYDPIARLGDRLERGAVVGRVHFIDDPLRAPAPVQTMRAGTVICRRHGGRVEIGDCVVQLAVETDAPVALRRPEAQVMEAAR